MADRTLYDILEVSSTASQESIRAAYERLSEKYQGLVDRGGDADARVHLDAVKQAFFTLANEEKRSQYDKRFEARASSGLRNVEVVETFWTLPKLIVIGLLVLGSGAVYYKYQRDQARIEAEKVIAETKAKQAAEVAKAEAEKEAFALQRQRESQSDEMRQRREREAALRQYSYDNRIESRGNQAQSSQQQRDAQRAEQ